MFLQDILVNPASLPIIQQINLFLFKPNTKMGVFFSDADGGMTHEFLYGADANALHNEVGGKGMAHGVDGGT